MSFSSLFFWLERGALRSCDRNFAPGFALAPLPRCVFFSYLLYFSFWFQACCSGNKVGQLVDVRLQEELLKKTLETNQWNTAPFEVTGFCFLKEKNLCFHFWCRRCLWTSGRLRAKKKLRNWFVSSSRGKVPRM